MTENKLFSDKHYIIYKNEKSLAMNLDSFLLAGFVQFNNSDKHIIELGCATGVVSMYIAIKKNKKIIGVDINDEAIQLLNKAVLINNIADKVKGLNIDILELNNYYKSNSFDVVVCNPPYYKTGKQNILKPCSKHEITISLDQIISKSQYLLKNKGKLFIILPVSRLDELFVLTNDYNLKVKELRFVHSFTKNEGRVVLIKLVKNAKIGLKVLKPLIVYDDINVYNSEILEIFKGSD